MDVNKVANNCELAIQDFDETKSTYEIKASLRERDIMKKDIKDPNSQASTANKKLSIQEIEEEIEEMEL